MAFKKVRSENTSARKSSSSSKSGGLDDRFNMMTLGAATEFKSKPGKKYLSTVYYQVFGTHERFMEKDIYDEGDTNYTTEEAILTAVTRFACGARLNSYLFNPKEEVAKDVTATGNWRVNVKVNEKEKVEKVANEQQRAELEAEIQDLLSAPELFEQDVLLKVGYTFVNYKDDYRVTSTSVITDENVECGNYDLDLNTAFAVMAASLMKNPAVCFLYNNSKGEGGSLLIKVNKEAYDGLQELADYLEGSVHPTENQVTQREVEPRTYEMDDEEDDDSYPPY